jgi:cytochrome c biogenesis protein CcmG/thiol:disulfide interchange protein DsbE
MQVKFFRVILFFLFLFIFSFSAQSQDKKALAPNFTAKDLDGKKVELKEVLANGPVLVSFWATSCKPCIKELSELQKVYKKYKEKDFEILAIDGDGPRSISKVKPMVKGLKWEFPVLWDESKDVSRKFHVLGIPHTVSFAFRHLSFFNHHSPKILIFPYRIPGKFPQAISWNII